MDYCGIVSCSVGRRELTVQKMARCFCIHFVYIVFLLLAIFLAQAQLRDYASFRDHIKSNRTLIVFAIFRIIWNQTDVRLVPYCLDTWFRTCMTSENFLYPYSLLINLLNSKILLSYDYNRISSESELNGFFDCLISANFVGFFVSHFFPLLTVIRFPLSVLEYIKIFNKFLHIQTYLC